MKNAFFSSLLFLSRILIFFAHFKNLRLFFVCLFVWRILLFGSLYWNGLSIEGERRSKNDEPWHELWPKQKRRKKLRAHARSQWMNECIFHLNCLNMIWFVCFFVVRLLIFSRSDRHRFVSAKTAATHTHTHSAAQALLAREPHSRDLFQIINFPCQGCWSLFAVVCCWCLFFVDRHTNQKSNGIHTRVWRV